MVNLSLLRNLVPLASLTATDRAELARQSRLGTYQPGQVLFNRGESAKTVVYLLSGEVELYTENGTTRVKGETDVALHPISQGARRTATGTCVKPAQVLLIDRERLDLVLTWSQSGGVEVAELDGGDWMSAMLTNPAISRIPPANIALLFASMKPAHYGAGEVVVTQGDPGEDYFVVAEGRVSVSRRDAQGEQELVQLGPGQAFGEEALLSGNPRNATVRALVPSQLMRLASADFARLLKAPILREIQPDEIPSDAVLIDVRLPEEYRAGRLPDSLNVPLSRLRDMAPELDPARCYVVYCDTGRRSASAAYLLCERGLDARLLAGGIPVDEMPVRG